jgi:hypothetical protein
MRDARGAKTAETVPIDSLIQFFTENPNPPDRNPRVTNLCGRNVDLDEFGVKGEKFITELYEQWLGSVQSGLVSTFCEDDEGHVNSAHILDYLGIKYEQAIKGKIVWRTEGDEIKRQRKGSLKWDIESSFEDWMILTMATLRWRLKEEIDGRRFTQALRNEEIQMAKFFVGECLSVVECWLSLPETKKLISV